ncbi:glycosyltransferase family 4 protein [Sphingomicrobium sediminis]|uniref:Glycosyltransferase family 4 protein n=1 Tax=Sphingomicrobium sediminis TaxID=2950949 RepID=A0A9X2J3X0_9SPHN|nr:glycosyltransferase family 4 protein [Sphingomicrobium sediminis]MCM8556632.1 glycosyltransferase family 4 protein [Sphingomicrobium sediminis]
MPGTFIGAVMAAEQPLRLMVDATRQRVGGGIQVALAVIDSAARDPGIELCVASSRAVAAELGSTDFPGHRVGDDLPTSWIVQQRALRRIERDFAPDLVLTVFGPGRWRSKAPNLQGFALGLMLDPDANRLGKSAMQQLKGKLADWAKIALFRRNADFLLAEADHVVAGAGELLGFPPEKQFVVPNSYSPRFLDNVERSTVKSPSDGTIRFFVPGAGFAHKNLQVLPAIAEQLKALGHDVRFTLTLKDDESAWQELEADADRRDIVAAFERVGRIPNEQMADAYLAHDFALCLSLCESSTAVIPEAFLAQRPLILADRPWARGLAGDGALFVDPIDPEAAAQAIDGLINRPRDQEALVGAGRRRLEQCYPPPEKRWQLYRSVIFACAGKDDGGA